MIERQNTLNQLPSNDLADLNDNTIIVDEFVNSQNDFTANRFGSKFKTLHKIVTDINKLSDEISVGALPATRIVKNEIPTYEVGDNVDFKKTPMVNGKSVITDLTDVDNKIELINTELSNTSNQINTLNDRIYVVESYHEGYSWYRVYSDGFIVQSSTALIGIPSANEVCGALINLLKPMKTQSYGVTVDKLYSGAWGVNAFSSSELYQSSFWLAAYSTIASEGWIRWTVQGY